MRDKHCEAAKTWHFNEAILFSNHPAVAAERQNQVPHLRAHGLHWDQAGAILKLRDELCEIDLRCTQMMPTGLLGELAAHLPHRMVEPTLAMRCAWWATSTAPPRLCNRPGQFRAA